MRKFMKYEIPIYNYDGSNEKVWGEDFYIDEDNDKVWDLLYTDEDIYEVWDPHFLH